MIDLLVLGDDAKEEEGGDKEKAPATVSEDAVFVFNDKYRNKLFRVKVMHVVQKETEPERETTKQKIDEDRKHMYVKRGEESFIFMNVLYIYINEYCRIEAAIVRTMKARKTMEHSNLIAEVTKQLSSRFRPNPLIIKKRIESLIEREYLERSKTNRKLYNYLA